MISKEVILLTVIQLSIMFVLAIIIYIMLKKAQKGQETREVEALASTNVLIFEIRDLSKHFGMYKKCNDDRVQEIEKDVAVLKSVYKRHERSIENIIIDVNKNSNHV